MLFKSNILAQASGRLGGSVYSHNAGGMYIRNGSTPVNPNTAAQQEARNAFSSLVTAWQGLTGAQRTDWETYAANVPVTNKFGDPVNISGQAMYIRLNAPRVRAAVTRIDDAPTVFTGADLSPINIDNIVPGAAGVATFDINFTDTDAWNADDGHLFVQMGPPQNVTRNFFGGPFRLVDTIDGNTAVPVTSPQTVTSPFEIAAGQRIFVRVRSSDPDGRLSPVQIDRADA